MPASVHAGHEVLCTTDDLRPAARSYVSLVEKLCEGCPTEICQDLSQSGIPEFWMCSSLRHGKVLGKVIAVPLVRQVWLDTLADSRADRENLLTIFIGFWLTFHVHCRKVPELNSSNDLIA